MGGTPRRGVGGFFDLLGRVLHLLEDGRTALTPLRRDALADTLRRFGDLGDDRAGSPDPLVIRMPVDVRSLSLSILAGLAVIISLQYAQSVLIPVVLGILLSLSLIHI